MGKTIIESAIYGNASFCKNPKRGFVR
ncbi:MAG: hypothetical protein YK1309IOTA_1620002, partial [Marine Group I thaumarchaeote]